MKKTLITGGLGFVGRQLVDCLVADGEEVACLDVLQPGTEPPATIGAYALSSATARSDAGWLYRGDAGEWRLYHQSLEEPEPLLALIEQLAPDVIHHLAAQSSAGLSFDLPRQTFVTNLLGTLNLLEAARTLPEGRWPVVLSIGSCEEYGAVQEPGQPLTEEAPLEPVSPYGVSKVAQTKLGQQYHTSFDLPVIAVRAFSHTGPGQDRRFVFPSFAAQIAAAESGRTPPALAVGDLSPVRDFLDVRDVLAAYRLLVDKGEPGQVYNVCSGRALTIQEGLEIMLRGACRPIAVKPDPARFRPSDIPHLVGDNTKLCAATGWRPQHDMQRTLAEILDLARKEI